MEPLNDKELNQLLRKWEAPAAPASMRMPASQSPWRWLWAGRIHVPVPVGVGIVFAVVVLGIYSSRSVPTAVSPSVGSAVASPMAPSTTPEPPSVIPPTEHTIPAAAEKDKAETAALSGFRPVGQLEPKILQVRP